MTQQRHDFPIPLPNAGNLGDYVPFYFGYRSPMLLNIQTGYRGVKQRSPSDIIYIVVDFYQIYNEGKKIIFTDGHAKSIETNFFDALTDLDKIDWEMVKSEQWKNTEKDGSRMRKKQAECLVQNDVLVNGIKAIVVYDDATKLATDILLQQLNLSIHTYINPKKKFYF